MRQLAEFRVCGACRGSAPSTTRSHKPLQPHANISRSALTSGAAGHNGRGAFSIRDQRSQVARGRCKTRIRYPHRLCRQRDLDSVLTLEFATINVQGWNWQKTDDLHRDKAAGVLDSARRGKWDIACLSEMHCTWNEELQHGGRNSIVALEEFIIIVGVRSAILLSPAAQQAWRARGCEKKLCADTGRFLSITLDIKGQVYSVVSGYAPTPGEPQDRIAFFEAAHTFREALPKESLQLWGGDWNSHVGRDSGGGAWQGIGKFSLTTPTDRPGKELLQWLSSGAPPLDLADSFFSIWKRGTWMHERLGVTKWFELDCFFMTPLLRKRVQKIKVFAMHFSDHFGKACSIALGKAAATDWEILRRKGEATQKKKLNLKAMSGPMPEMMEKRKQYADACEKNLSADFRGITNLSESLVQSAEEVVGRGSSRVGLPYLAGHVKEAQQWREQIQEAHAKIRSARNSAEELELKRSHRKISNEARQLRRRWRREWISNMTEQLGKAMHFGDTGRFYAGLRELGADLKDFSSKGLITHGPEQLREHYAKLVEDVNTVPEEVLERLPPNRPVCEALATAPDEEEVLKQMKLMRPSAAGKDEVTITMILWGGPRVIKQAIAAVQKMWVTEPEDWESCVHEVVVWSLWKGKKSPQDLDNHRGISLINIFARIIARIIAGRLRDYCEREQILSDDQWGFRPLRSTLGALFVVRRLVDLAVRVSPDAVDDKLVIEPLDIKKAYPSASRNASERIQENEGIPLHLRRLQEGLLTNASFVCRTSIGDSQPFKANRGFKEGCPNSCTAFNIYHNAALRDYKTQVNEKQDGGGIQGRTANGTRLHPTGGLHGRKYASQVPNWPQFFLDMVCFADDTNLVHRQSVADSRRELVTTILKDWGEIVHPGKWQHMAAQRDNTDPLAEADLPEQEEAQEQIFWDKAVEVLGSWVSADGSIERDLFERLKKARKLWYQLYRRLPKLGLTTRQKGMVIQATVEACLLYGCEVMVHTTIHLDIMQRFMNRVVRALTLSAKLTIKDMKGKLTQTDLRLQTGLDAIAVRIADRTLGFLGHVARRGEERLEWKLLYGWLESESELPSQRKGGTWAKQADDWLKMLENEAGDGTPWFTLARELNDRGKHVRWDTLRKQVVEKLRARHDSDTHAHRHRNDGATAAAPQPEHAAEAAKAQAKPKGVYQKVTCKCGATLAKWSLRGHLALSCPLRRGPDDFQPRARPSKAKPASRGVPKQGYLPAPPLPGQQAVPAPPLAPQPGEQLFPLPSVHARRKRPPTSSASSQSVTAPPTAAFPAAPPPTAPHTTGTTSAARTTGKGQAPPTAGAGAAGTTGTTSAARTTGKGRAPPAAGAGAASTTGTALALRKRPAAAKTALPPGAKTRPPTAKTGAAGGAGTTGAAQALRRRPAAAVKAQASKAAPRPAAAATAAKAAAAA